MNGSFVDSEGQEWELNVTQTAFGSWLATLRSVAGAFSSMRQDRDAAVDAVLELWHTYDRHLGAVIGRGDLPSPEEAFNEIRRLGIHVDD